MSDGGALRWFLSISDGVSAPASSAEKKLADLEKRMKSFKKAADETTDPALQKRLASKLSGLGVEKIDALGMAAAEQHSSGWVSTLDHGLGIVEKIGEAAMKVGEKIADWTVDAVKLAGGKEREFISFKAMLHDGPAAKSLMEQLEQVSRDATFSDDQAMSLGRRLLAGGFNADEIPTFVKSLADAAGATGASFDKVEAAVGIMRRIQSEGKVTDKMLRQLGAAGITTAGLKASLDPLYDMVKNIRHVRAGGVLGSAGAAAVAESSDMLMSKVKERWEDNFSGLWETKGFGKWKGFLTNLNNSLDVTSTSGKRLQESIGGAFDHLLGGVFGEVSGPNGLKGTDDLVGKLAGTFDRAGIAAGSFAEGLMASLNPALKNLGILSDGPLDPEKARMLGLEFKKFGETIGGVVEGLASVVGYLKDAGKVLGFVWQYTGPGMLMDAAGVAGKALGGNSIGSAIVGAWDGTSTPEPAPQPSTTLTTMGARTSTKTGTVHQTIHVHGGATVDPKAIGDATRAGQKSALEDDEDRAGDHGSYEE